MGRRNVSGARRATGVTAGERPEVHQPPARPPLLMEGLMDKQGCRHIQRARARAPRLFSEAFGRAVRAHLLEQPDKAEARLVYDHLEKIYERWQAEMPKGAW